MTDGDNDVGDGGVAAGQPPPPPPQQQQQQQQRSVLLAAGPLPPESFASATSRPHVPSISASAVLGESATMPEGTPICRGFDFDRWSPGGGGRAGGRGCLPRRGRRASPTRDEGGESGGERGGEVEGGDNDKHDDHNDDGDGDGDGDDDDDDDCASATLPNGSKRPTDVLDELVSAMLTTGFQATSLAEAVGEIRRMRSWRLSDEPYRDGHDDPDLADPDVRSRIRARIFLAYTSNQISSGQREVIRFLVRHGMVDVLVTTAGGIEEDIIKCFEPTFMGDFKLKGKDLRSNGINRIGNLLVPNRNYCKFEDWFAPLLNAMHDEQDEAWKRWRSACASLPSSSSSGNGGAKRNNNDDPLPPMFVWTPSKVIERLGREVADESSVLYWAARNSIPVFCPALTDGSIGDMMYFHTYKRPGFVLDIVQDVRRINDLAVRSHATGMIVLGGGVVKHHTCNANLMRNGANFAVYVTTATEFDGSDSGASPDEAVSWGKIRMDATPVKVCCDATIAFPIIVSQTFAKDVEAWKDSTKGCICWLDDEENESKNA